MLVSNDVPNGALVSEAISVQVPAPAGETPKATRTAPPPVVAVSETVPETTAPGSVSVTLGPVESTVTGFTAVVRTLPAASVITARISVAPSGALDAFHVRVVRRGRVARDGVEGAGAEELDLPLDLRDAGAGDVGRGRRERRRRSRRRWRRSRGR